MVRPGYRLNDDILLPIFPVPTENFPEGLTGFRAMNPSWGIDWGRFVDIDIRDHDGSDDVKKRRLQFAYRIDTSAVNPLGNLPTSVAANPASLPERNLLRGWRLGLPTGQSVAHAMGISPLADDQILLGKFTKDDPKDLNGLTPITEIANGVFAGNCPLWTYILAETRSFKEAVKLPVTENVTLLTPKLGSVGGRIVAEVFLGILFGDGDSYLNVCPNWTPAEGADYKLKDFVKYALGK